MSTNTTTTQVTKYVYLNQYILIHGPKILDYSAVLGFARLEQLAQQAIQENTKVDLSKVTGFDE